MKRTSIIVAIVLCFSLALSACGNNSTKDTPLTQTSGTKEPANSTSQQPSGNNNSTDVGAKDMANNDDGYDTAPNPLTISEGSEGSGDIDSQLLWYYNGNGITIHSGIMSNAEAVIPQTIKLNGIEESVTAIAEKAFATCGTLRSITVPDSVVSVGKDVFKDTAFLKNHPAGPIYIGSVLYGFTSAPPAGDFEIKEGTTTIGEGAFAQAVNLTSVKIPSSVLVIESGAFDGCTEITSLALPSSVESISETAFGYFAQVPATMPDGVKIVPDPMLLQMTAVPMPPEPGAALPPDGPIYKNSVLNGYNFAGDRSQWPAELTVEDGTTEIRIWLGSFRSVTVPDSVTYIKNNQNNDYAEALWENSPDGPLYLGRVFYGYKGNMPANTSVEIKDGTVTVGEYALAGHETLTSVAVPSGVSSIGRYAFSGCANLTSVVMPYSLTTIGDRAFEGCKNLSITAPVGSYAQAYAIAHNIPFTAE